MLERTAKYSVVLWQMLLEQQILIHSTASDGFEHLNPEPLFKGTFDHYFRRDAPGHLLIREAS
jgi:hypothetical protein